uniref:Protein WAP-3 n=1 Tax=Sus scrofa TaxID=9823 RepID=WAP3_PIG|nr:protein WAP-3 precursor [Sus scrofa]Q29126.1 RecName: Full=Protein WAP-3; Flags: Precursor [Sus scrofa]BAA08856.1 elafin family member protein [Sus scrofa]
MRSRSFLVLVAVFLICETLVAQRLDRIRGPKGQGQDPVEGQDQDEGQGPVKVEILDIGQDLVKGQDPVEGQDPVKAQLPDKVQDPVKAQPPIQGGFLFPKPGVCPKIIFCPLVNPPIKCWRDSHCPGVKKCCPSLCGKGCVTPR